MKNVQFAQTTPVPAAPLRVWEIELKRVVMFLVWVFCGALAGVLCQHLGIFARG